MGDRREPSVSLPEERLLPSPPSTSSNPTLSSIGPERWSRAEKATQSIIHKVQPTVVSEERRREVIDYVQRLIRSSLGCGVFPYGSVPLKTYLPDGDIDLTAFGGMNIEDVLANEMVSVLEGEEKNRDSEFVVKDVQLIRAEVKLVKCIVQNIVVDISFNQIGGLCTLCFLEQVDRRIGKDHLFKRSIILIKAWCYYESRILGAHHGLISTYALETLVLYIFHLFHLTLSGPLAVLYKFLDYFSKFDWDNYCISLTGPVRISSLPEIVAETPESDGSGLLIDDDFLRYCVDNFSVPLKGADINSRTFLQKHLNIIDPLKENNNLGRSVSKGNFYRIRSAFTYGARKLGRILLQSEDSIADELFKFFSNTLDRHGSGQRPDVQDSILVSGHESLSPALLVPEIKSCQKENVCSLEHTDANGDCKFFPKDSLNIMLLGEDAKLSRTKSGRDRGSVGAEIDTAFENCCRVDTKGIDISRIQGFEISEDSSKSSCPGSESNSPLSGLCYAPHQYFSNSVNGRMRSKHEDAKQPEKQCFSIHTAPSESAQESKTGLVINDDQEGQLACSGEILSVSKSKATTSVENCDSLEDLNPSICSRTPTRTLDTPTRTSASPDGTNLLSDLSGDFDSHVTCLQYGRWCYEYAVGPPTLPMSLSPLLPYQSKMAWDAVHRSPHLKQNGFQHVTQNGVIPNPAYYHVSPIMIPGAAFGNFGLEEMPKPRGTGTYFPRTYRPPHGYRPSVKGRNQGTARSPRNNGHGMAPFSETNNHERSSREQSLSQISIYHGNRSSSSDAHQSVAPGKKVLNNGNGFLQHDVVEFGSVGHVSPCAPSKENIKQPKGATSLANISGQGHLTPGMHQPKPLLALDRDSVTVQNAYHLKNDEDFPPLPI